MGSRCDIARNVPRRRTWTVFTRRTPGVPEKPPSVRPVRAIAETGSGGADAPVRAAQGDTIRGEYNPALDG